MSQFNPTTKTVETDGAKLQVWFQGSGPLLILMHGGMGRGAQFNAAMPSLAEHYTVASYDRRGNADSTGNKKNAFFNPAQSARDLAAMMEALDFKKTSLYATSGAGIIAFQFGIMFPEKVEHIICYETPTLSLLPDNTEGLDFVMHIYDTYKNEGTVAAQKLFAKFMVGLPKELQKPGGGPSVDFFYEYEFLMMTLYTPNLTLLKKNNVSIAVASGVKSLDAQYARSPVVQANIIGCRKLTWPGHHVFHVTDPDVFVHAVLDALQQLSST